MSTGNPEFFRKNRKNRRKYVPAVLQSIFENTPADEFADNGILRHIARGQRRQLPDDIHENVQSVRAHEFRRQLFRELRNLAQVLGQDARLIVVEGVNVDGGIRLVGGDILHLALIDRARSIVSRSVLPRER